MIPWSNLELLRRIATRFPLWRECKKMMKVEIISREDIKPFFPTAPHLRTIATKVEIISRETIKPSIQTPPHLRTIATRFYSLKEGKKTIKVEIMSRETIKPSSPTPPHLRSFKLSLLDQLIPQIYTPLIFFYPIEEGNEGRTQTVAERSNQLKKSLSETLMWYYPLAGRIQDDFSIDCNDDGVDYLEAKVNSELSKFLKEPEIEVLHQFLPCEFDKIETENDIAQLAIQVNNFDCGGLAIGMCFLHKIMDGPSCAAFITDWASIARGSSEAVRPILIQDSFFPSRDFSGFMPLASEVKLTTRTRRFVFDGSNINALKAELINNYSSSLKHPTRVQVASTFLWQKLMSASKANPDFAKKLFVARHAVNMRGRMIPPLPRNSIGNFGLHASVSLTVENESEFGDLVGQLSEAISKVNDERLRELQGDPEAIFRIFEDINKIYSLDEVESFIFSSVCNYPLYETDFGWGKPLWISMASSPNSDFSNCVVMMDTRMGNGIEAWVTLDEKAMVALERDKELLAFALSSPSALD